MTHLQFDAKEKSLLLQFCKTPNWILLRCRTVEPMIRRFHQAKGQRNMIQGSKLQRITHQTRNRFCITYIMRSMDQVTVEYQRVMLYGRAFGFPVRLWIHRFNVGMILRKSHLTFLTPPRSLPLRPPVAHIQILNSHFSGNGVAEVLNRGSEGAVRRGSLKPDSGFAPGSRVHANGPAGHGSAEAGLPIHRDVVR